MRITKERILELQDLHRRDHDIPVAMDSFIDGLQIIFMNSKTKPDYCAQHDVIYVGHFENMYTLDEDAVIRLRKLGWRFNSELDCFEYNT